MYALKVKCSCGAILELEFDRYILATTYDIYDRFLKIHEVCKEYYNDSDPPAANPDVLNRLDETNPNI